MAERQTIDVRGRTLELIGSDTPYTGQWAVEKGEIQVKRYDMKVRKIGRYHNSRDVVETGGRGVTSLTPIDKDVDRNTPYPFQRDDLGKYIINFLRRRDVSRLKIGTKVIAVNIQQFCQFYNGRYEESYPSLYNLLIEPASSRRLWYRGGQTFPSEFYGVIHEGKVIYELPKDEPQYFEKLKREDNFAIKKFPEAKELLEKIVAGKD